MTDDHTEENRAGILMRVVAPLLVLGCFVGLGVWLVKTKPDAGRRQPPAQAAVVDVMKASTTNRAIIVEAMGEVIPARSVDLKAEVSGRIIEQNKKLVEGGRFSEGEVMIKIEPDDYEAAVAQAEAALEQAKLNAALEEQRHAVAVEEWKISGQTATNEVVRQVVLREPHLKAMRAAKRSAESALSHARRNLERTVLHAPFDCVVLQEFTDEGLVVLPQSALAQVAGTDRFFVRVSVPVDALKSFDIPGAPDEKGADVSVVLRGSDGVVSERTGCVVQLLGALAPAGRMARVLVEVQEPLEAAPAPLLLGAYVRCSITGDEITEVVPLPRSVVRDGDNTWVVGPDEKLEVRRLDIAWQTRDEVFAVGGVAPGELVVKTQLPSAIHGMQLRLAGSEPKAPPAGGGQGKRGKGKPEANR